MIVGIHHIAVGVPDLNAAKEFYERAFGFAVVEETQFSGSVPLVEAAIGIKEPSAKMCMMRAPNAYIEVWEYTAPLPRNKHCKPYDHGYPHIALEVTDIEHEHQRLSDLGVDFVGPPVSFGNSSAIYGTDPFGNLIELYEILDRNRAHLGNIDPGQNHP